MAKHKSKTFTESEFKDHEEWEKQAHDERDDHHGDKDKRISGAHTYSSQSYLNQVQKRHKKRLNSKGIGHSKDPKKPSWKEENDDE